MTQERLHSRHKDHIGKDHDLGLNEGLRQNKNFALTKIKPSLKEAKRSASNLTAYQSKSGIIFKKNIIQTPMTYFHNVLHMIWKNYETRRKAGKI